MNRGTGADVGIDWGDDSCVGQCGYIAIRQGRASCSQIPDICGRDAIQTFQQQISRSRYFQRIAVAARGNEPTLDTDVRNLTRIRRINQHGPASRIALEPIVF